MEEKSPRSKLAEDYPSFRYEETLEAPCGWIPRIRKLTEDIIERLGPDFTLEDFEVAQVKEKFGGLRYYAYGERLDEVSDLIDEAERDCYKLCQICGASGSTVTTGHWMVTLCPTHAEEREKRIAQRLRRRG